MLICPQYNVPAFAHDHRPLKERTMVVDGQERGYSDSAFWSGIANAPFLPSTAFPSGFSGDVLPLGLQATCPSYRDNRSIEIARLISLEIGGFTPPARMLASTQGS